MTQVMILLAALSGYHGTQTQCNEVAKVLCDLAIYNAIDGSPNHKAEYNHSYPVDNDIRSIKRFNEACQKKKTSK